MSKTGEPAVSPTDVFRTAYFSRPHFSRTASKKALDFSQRVCYNEDGMTIIDAFGKENFLMKHVFIVNPAAGKENATEAIEQGIQASSCAADCEIYLTKAPGDATAYIRSYCQSHR